MNSGICAALNTHSVYLPVLKLKLLFGDWAGQMRGHSLVGIGCELVKECYS